MGQIFQQSYNNLDKRIRWLYVWVFIEELQLCHGFNDRTTDTNRDRILLTIKKNIYKQKRENKKRRKYKLFCREGCLLLYVPMTVDNNAA